jgi:phospholipid/cholesterol/gamma-HCH transport system substrate-binding protein
MTRTNDFALGLITVSVIGALVGGVAWINQTSIGQREHSVVAQFRDVGNARVGNAVVIRGVVGGRIEGIELASEGWVDVRMRLDPDVRLPYDPVVLLNESSLFGEWQATVIERTSLPHDEVVARDVTAASSAHGKLPGATLPGIGKLTAVAGQIAGDVASVAGRVELAFDDAAARKLRGSIRNVSDLSTTLADVVRDHASDLDTLSHQLRAVIASLDRTARTVSLTAERIDSAATSPQARGMVEDLSVGAFELRRAATQVRDLSERIAETQGRLDGFLARGDSVLAKINAGKGSMGLLINDPSLHRQMDSLLVELRALVADVKANPKKYVSVKLF